MSRNQKLETLINNQAAAMDTLQQSALGWCEHIMILEGHIKAQEEVIKMAMDCFNIENRQIGLSEFVHKFLEQANKNLHKKDDVLTVFRKTLPHFLKDT